MSRPYCPVPKSSPSGTRLYCRGGHFGSGSAPARSRTPQGLLHPGGRCTRVLGRSNSQRANICLGLLWGDERSKILLLACCNQGRTRGADPVSGEERANILLLACCYQEVLFVPRLRGENSSQLSAAWGLRRNRSGQRCRLHGRAGVCTAVARHGSSARPIPTEEHDVKPARLARNGGWRRVLHTGSGAVRTSRRLLSDLRGKDSHARNARRDRRGKDSRESRQRGLGGGRRCNYWVKHLSRLCLV